ncbi:MAG: chromosome segregation protein SMC, partial [Peptococcaceae bacterium]|nr:chromosome segregation protein SMC [Peptococcaceae bacterium]
KKIEDTNRNLQRLADILSELESQLQPLAHQVETAKRWLDLNREQRTLEIQFVVKELTLIDQRLRALNDQAEELEHDWAQSAALLANKETLHTQLKQRLLLIEEKIQISKEQVYQAEQALAENQHKIQMQAERIRYRNDEIARLHNEYTDIQGKQDVLTENLLTWQDKRAQITVALQSERQEVSRQEQEISSLQAASDEQVLERLKAELFEAMAKQAETSNMLTGLRQRAESVDKQSAQNTQERSVWESDLRSVLEAIRLDEEQLRQTQERGKELDAIRALEQAQLQQWEEEIRTLTDEAERVSRRLAEAAARRNALLSLEDSLEGYQRGVREVILGKRQGKQELNGVYGTAAELIQVEQPYELALETAVGGGLQNIIARDMVAAKAGIRYLKQNQLGRATFLPLDTIWANPLQCSTAVQKTVGFIGRAVDLITFDAQYRPAMESLFGRIIVVDKLDTATEVARLTDYRVRVVSLDGDLVNPGGSLTGGSAQPSRGNLLSRAREISERTQEMQKLQEQTHRQKEQLTTLLERKQEQIQRIQENEAAEMQLRERQATLRAALDHREIQKKRGQEELRFQKLKGRDLAEEGQTLQQEVQRTADALHACEDQVSQARDALAKQELSVREATSILNELAEHLTQHKVAVATLEQEHSQAALLLKQTADQQRELASEATEKQTAWQLTQETLLSEQEAVESLSVEAEDREAGLAQMQLGLDQLRGQRQALAAEMAEAERSVEALRRAAQDAEQRKHQQALNLVRLEADWENGLNKLAEEFDLHWEDTEAYKEAPERSSLAARLAELKMEIESLGPVNQAALEEYPKLEERYRFMNEQRQDLLDARETLESLIGELDVKMSERFAKGFAAVNEAFQKTFRELFNGGAAELRLLDPADLLATGVEIIAQPPGKKLQWLSLLSGGERALTAIALIFALLRVKPSPFCILDEIEASLDDVNVRRFAAYLQQLSRATQFIVISHRKGTMAEADVLYGVTMEQSGTSRLLSVSMSEEATGDAFI